MQSKSVSGSVSFTSEDNVNSKLAKREHKGKRKNKKSSKSKPIDNHSKMVLAKKDKM